MLNTPRERLAHIAHDIYCSSCERINDPANVAKGDGYLDLSLDELGEMLDAEIVELVVALRGGSAHSPRHEAGDVLTILAMMLQKAEREGGDE